jgi:hypothetical protein
MADPLADYAELEIVFRKRDASSYALHFTLTSPNDDAEISSGVDPVIVADFSQLSDADPNYAATLTSLVFPAAPTAPPPADPPSDPGAAPAVPQKSAREWFNTLRHARDLKLRLRLTIDPSAPELHAVHWETLLDPDVADHPQPLFMGELLLLSRFLPTAGSDWRPIRRRPKSQLKALVVIAKGPAKYNLPPVDVARELAIARQAMASIDLTELASDSPNPPTYANLAAQLDRGFDILYLVCHGRLKDAEPQLFLDGDAMTPAGDLALKVAGLDFRPTLIVLASCQSAGAGGANSGVPSAIGPRLAAAGVPAIIAMQGNVFMQTSDAFMHTFFTGLCQHGQIDRAVSAARLVVFQQKAEDYWKPVLFTRLRSGRMWYEPGFKGDNTDFAGWPDLVSRISQGRFVPILGPDLAEHLIGSSRDIASQVAAATSFPLDSHDATDLAKVAQYLSKGGATTDVAMRTVYNQIYAELQRTAARLLPAPLPTAPDALWDPVVEAVLHAQNPQTPADPFAILASLPAAVFINASGAGLLERFVARAKSSTGAPKQPVVVAPDWVAEVPRTVVLARDPDGAPDLSSDAPLPLAPTADAPTIYDMFGEIAAESPNWVLTEDDYFDFLIKTCTYNLIPAKIKALLGNNQLLFLGFAIDDLKFRALLRILKTIPRSSGSRTQFRHIGVQVDPSETSFADAQRARIYLQDYLKETRIDIYWGSSTDFLRELKQQMDAASSGARPL